MLSPVLPMVARARFRTILERHPAPEAFHSKKPYPFNGNRRLDFRIEVAPRHIRIAQIRQAG
jgi:hypothetical protein